jgi:cell division septum initiation protein DivIVA
MKVPDELTNKEVTNVINYLMDQIRHHKQENKDLCDTLDELLVQLQAKDLEIVSLRKRIIDNGIANA